MREAHYDNAQICPNGHVVTEYANFSPDRCAPFCTKCGEATVRHCSNCKAPIRGAYHVPGVFGSWEYQIPAFCHQCGTVYPWTERAQRAAIDLFIDETQDKADRKEFEESVEQISKDTPQAQVASRRIGKLLKTVGSESAKTIRDILVRVASDAVKGSL